MTKRGAAKRLAAVAVSILCVSLMAQTGETFNARLSTVPIDPATRANITGFGSASAVLTGSRLVIQGSFEGLQGPATVAGLHQGPATGAHGDGAALFALTVSHSASGTVSGSLDLTQEQVRDLRAGRLYIQIHSEKAPDGNLWGWLLK